MQVYYLCFILIILFTAVEKGFSQQVNIALNKPAIQPRTYFQFYPNLAVDGDAATRSVAEPDDDDFTWWQVDLGRDYSVTTVQILNSNVSQDHEDITTIFVTIRANSSWLYSPENLWSFNSATVQPGGTLTMTKTPESIAASSGRYVTIFRYKPADPKARNVVSLAEVRIFAVSDNDSSATSPTTSIHTTSNQSIVSIPAENKKENDFTMLAIGLSLGIGVSLIILTFIVGFIIGKRCSNHKSDGRINCERKISKEIGQEGESKFETNEYDIAKNSNEGSEYLGLKKTNAKSKSDEHLYQGVTNPDVNYHRDDGDYAQPN